jgi:hypothetical protein
MEIHKPKPWHGWREFLKEYLIIVVGVLTALGGEQVVEWLHWRHLAHEAEERLALGLRYDLLNAADWLMTRPCLNARLSGLATELAKPGTDWKADTQPVPAGWRGPSVLPVVVGGHSRLWDHVAWETALGSGVLNHMPGERVDTYAEIYRLVEYMRGQQPALLVAQARLAPLGYDRKLSEAERTEFIGQVGEVAAMQNSMFNSAGAIIRDAQAIGVDPSRPDLDKRLAELRAVAGACVQDLKPPLASPASADHP